eukprot:5088894-Heterocapsa_arctica.AAC.1
MGALPCLVGSPLGRHSLTSLAMFNYGFAFALIPRSGRAEERSSTGRLRSHWRHSITSLAMLKF